ncbi:MAG: MBL fold metallo-hydrolase [Thermoleophilaceae bacterium]
MASPTDTGSDAVRCIELRWQGEPEAICSWVVDGSILVDPGPASCVEALVAQLDGEPELVLLTHVHLDHAGASGALARRFPSARFAIHRSAVRHLEDPSRLLASASRVYGDRLEELWGSVEPVPGERIVALDGGDEIDGFEVLATPGHAAHHLTYVHPASGTAFTGDVAGVRSTRAREAFPPTPPPQVDVPAWLESIEALRERRPERLALTHFGAYEDVSHHLSTVAENLRRWAALAREVDAVEFERRIREQIRASGPAGAGDAIERGLGPDHCWAGLDRYWSTRADEAGTLTDLKEAKA